MSAWLLLAIGCTKQAPSVPVGPATTVTLRFAPTPGSSASELILQRLVSVDGAEPDGARVRQRFATHTAVSGSDVTKTISLAPASYELIGQPDDDVARNAPIMAAVSYPMVLGLAADNAHWMGVSDVALAQIRQTMHDGVRTHVPEGSDQVMAKLTLDRRYTDRLLRGRLSNLWQSGLGMFAEEPTLTVGAWVETEGTVLVDGLMGVEAPLKVRYRVEDWRPCHDASQATDCVALRMERRSDPSTLGHLFGDSKTLTGLTVQEDHLWILDPRTMDAWRSEHRSETSLTYRARALRIESTRTVTALPDGLE
ncbi:MAG: hypothetical protein KTR31_17150 [Myxococcales bacterium]|nr:hypothetical protein [Myxococcales bacterium]